MTLRKAVPSLVACAAALGMLAGCSAADLIIWGPEGASVIQTTEHLIEAAASAEADALACEDSVAEYREPENWSNPNLSAGEPERISRFWQAQADLGATWSINLEAAHVGVGDSIPGDVFYREDDGKLCVVDIAWSTVEFVSE
ncbi:hypothetical protein [Homoserinimonas hongtaonis]|uniref:hypothetical protein n=1 Tax=Homoserinimonas hongtaonis TaxID=2079791 RepID=UPI001F5473A3|nr:hypothetical protein [Salinibacterium hongtaonis]